MWGESYGTCEVETRDALWSKKKKIRKKLSSLEKLVAVLARKAVNRGARRRRTRSDGKLNREIERLLCSGMHERSLTRGAKGPAYGALPSL